MGAYRILEQVGRGGQGHVFKAECAGRFFGLKFFLARPVAPWGEREIDILRWLEHPNVVRVLGYGRWPDPEHGLLYLVMEWVEGLPLEDHARTHGLSAREVATLVSKVARALAQVHRQGALHRDIKPDNILVRRTDGAPVLVDFGVSHLEGLSSVEGRGQLVGTPEFYSPEAYQFLWDHYGDGTYYPGAVSDEVWAVGVTLYWLLTRTLPFGSRATNLDMVKHIRTRTPQVPWECNPRVPVALGQMCMRLLEKEPAARYEDMEDVWAALEGGLAGAEGDEGWDVPLAEPETPPEVEAEAARVEESPPVREPVPAPVEAAVLPPVRQSLHVPPVAAEPGHVEGAPLLPPARERNVWRRMLSHVVPSWVGVLPLRAMARSALGRAALVLLPVLVMAAVGVGLFASRTRSPVSAGEEVEAIAPPPAGLVGQCPTSNASLFHEVATAEKPIESGVGAVPYFPSLPASEFATAMLRKEDSRSKSEEKPAPGPQRKVSRRCVPTLEQVCTAGACTFLLTGCTGTTQVVNPSPSRVAYRLPKPEACPPGALETMDKLGIRTGLWINASLIPFEATKILTVRESSTFTTMEFFGELPQAELSGKLFFSEDRVYGRFTQARVRGGKTYNICMALVTRSGRELGVDRKDIGGPADSAMVFSEQAVKAVKHFE
ncbi:serine/threonine protein kinase [Vitiosangium sp. GDMCC 1.1324]|uniref:serine/threonine protein kinase n=1 Tax=Vitiosangium sp. (strain GDMCC 1.1324) TaxID=2138576 RepID=UPI00130EC787|nr:serine/threonine protein kinase [Vitiosangium sp. GDMCC 1.1324]